MSDDLRPSHLIADPQHGGMPVARFFHPTGWQVRSDVSWNAQNTSQPVLVRAIAASPDGRDALEFLPHEGCCWVQPNYGLTPGSNRYGLTLLPPMPPVDAMVNFLIPKHRGDPRNYRVVRAEPVADLAQRTGARDMLGVAPSGAIVRVEADVELGGASTTIVEEFTSLHYAFAPIAGQVAQQNWGLARAFSIRSDREHFDQLHDELWADACSIVYNGEWSAVCERVAQQLNGQFTQAIQAGYDKLRSEAQFEQQFLAFNQQVRDNQSAAVAASVAHQQQVNAARWAPPGGAASGGQSAQDAWGDTLLGRTAYQDPDNAEGNYWYDDGTHDYVWTDGQGGFVPTDDPNFDPNINSDRSWSLAKRA